MKKLKIYSIVILSLVISACSETNNYYLKIISGIKKMPQEESKDFLSTATNCYAVALNLYKDFELDKFKKNATHYNKLFLAGLLARHSDISDDAINKISCAYSQYYVEKNPDTFSISNAFSICNIDKNDSKEISEFKKNRDILLETLGNYGMIYRSHKISEMHFLDSRVELAATDKESEGLMLEYYSNNCSYL